MNRRSVRLQGCNTAKEESVRYAEEQGVLLGKVEGSVKSDETTITLPVLLNLAVSSWGDSGGAGV